VYRLLIKRSAERDLRRLPRPLFQRISRHILALGDDPRPAGARKLKGALEGWRIRIGDYRVVYQIDDGTQRVTVVRIRHRRDVYGP
jgi:mRNA interferase RelE/StbE